MTTPENANATCVGPESSTAGKADSCAGCPNQKDCSSGAFSTPDPALLEIRDRLSQISSKILILSGKGGVGKSTISSQLAWKLGSHNASIGVLDIDICGPSMPRMMGVETSEVHKSSLGWSPVYASDNIGVMSIGFMLNSRNDAVIWRGPRKNGLIKQFLSDVNWGELDVLLIDAPPGTSDEHISIVKYLKEGSLDGAVIVTTPQEVALLDVRKEITFCRKVGVDVIGVVENMNGFVCPCCDTRSDVFGGEGGGARGMCEEMGVRYLGSVSLDPRMVKMCDAGKSFAQEFPDAKVTEELSEVVENVMGSSERLRNLWEDVNQ